MVQALFLVLEVQWSLLDLNLLAVPTQETE